MTIERSRGAGGAGARGARSRAWLCACAALGAGCATTQSQAREAESAEVRERMQTIQRITWEELVDQGERASSSGDFTRSEQYYASAIQRGGPPERVLPRLLRVCVNAHRYRAAVEYARPYLSQHEEAWALRFLVASIHIGLSEPLTASRHLELVLRHNPRHAEAEFLLASLLRDDLRDPGGADEHFRRYLALEPDGEHAPAARSGLLTRVEEVAAQARAIEADGGVTGVVTVGAGMDAGAGPQGLMGPTVSTPGSAGGGGASRDAGARDSDAARRR